MRDTKTLVARTRVCFAVVGGILLLAGCQPENQGSRAQFQQRSEEYDRQMALAKEHQDETSRQLEAGWKQYKVAEEQRQRLDALLKRWEEQADRYDAILHRWEKQEAPRTPSR